MTATTNTVHGTAHVPEKTVKCPNCGGPSLYAARNAYRPFCCERCKLGDLGHWASEAFRVPAPPGNDTENLQ